MTGLAALLGTVTPAAAQTPLVAAVLPASRSVQVNNWATVFATLMNTSPHVVTGCAIAPITSVPANFFYQTTDPSTNELTGTPNTPVSINPYVFQTFVLSFQPTSAFDPTMIDLAFTCTNTDPAPNTPGVNTVLLSGSTTPVPDVVALAATVNESGIMSLNGPGWSEPTAFAVATVNLGAGGAITANVNTGSATLPLNLRICQPTASSVCNSPVSPTITVDIANDATPTFVVYGIGTAAIPFDPTNNRVYVQFADSTGAIRGETRVAVEAATPHGVDPYGSVP